MSSASGTSQLGRMQNEWPRLRAADAAVEGDQLLERAARLERRVVEAADHDVGDMGEPVGAEEVLRSGRREGCERILALDTPVREVAGAVRAECERPVLGGADEEPADVWVVAQRRDQVGMAFVHLLERQAASFLHQVDEPEVAGAHHDDVLVGDVVLRALLLGLPCRWPRRTRSRPSSSARHRPRGRRRSRARGSARRARRARSRCAA